MTEASIFDAVRKAIQDVVAPGLRELKANLASLEKTVDVRFHAVDARLETLEKMLDVRFDAVAERFDAVAGRFDAVAKQMQSESEKRDLQFATLLAHMREASAEAKNATTQQVYDLAQRLTVVETRQALEHPRQLS